jgi:hypothetical protein
MQPITTTDLELTAARKERLTELSKLKAWQILLALFFIFVLFLPSLAAPPSLLTAWSVLCSVLIYRWWVTRTTARALLADQVVGRSVNAVCWQSLLSVAWKSFLILVLIPGLLMGFIAPTQAIAATAIAISLMTWVVSLLLSADAAWGVVSRINPSASISVLFGVLSALFLGAGVYLAVPALVAGLAARKQLKALANEERGVVLARIGIGFAAVVLAVNIVMLSYFALTGTLITSANSQTAPSGDASTSAPKGPPPSGTAEDLHARFKAYGERTGDARLAGVMEANFSLIQRLEDRSRDMVEANNQLNVEVMVDPENADAASVERQVQVLGMLQNAALAYKDTALQFREMTTAEMSKTHSDAPQQTAEALDLSQPGMVLAMQWSDTAIAFSTAARRFLQTFQDTGRTDPDLFEALAVRGEEYDAVLDKMQERLEKNQKIIHEHLPR